MWRAIQSIRFRLALVTYVICSATLLLSVLPILFARTYELHKGIDEQLAARAAGIHDWCEERLDSAAISPVPSIPFPYVSNAQARGPLRSIYHVRVTDSGGGLIYRTQGLIPPSVFLEASADRDGAGAFDERNSEFNFVTVSPQGERGTYRVCRSIIQRKDSGGGDVLVQVARNMSSVHESVQRLWWISLVVLAIAMGAAAPISWLVSGRLLRPIRQIATRVDGLSLATLGDRIETVNESEFGAMVASLNAMLDRLQASFEAQERFIAAVSHELRTPASIILGQAQVLAMQRRSSDEYEKFLVSVQEEVRSMSRTMDSLLTLSKAEAGLPVRMDPCVAVNEVVMDAVARLLPSAAERDVRLVPDLAPSEDGGPEPQVTGNGELFRVMVMNLLRNAVHHAPSGSAVEVSVEVSSTNLTIRVGDRGPGIPDSYAERVFDRFFQVPGVARANAGAGLGLTIVRSVATLHGGEVHVANRKGGGCMFTVVVPLAFDG